MNPTEIWSFTAIPQFSGTQAPPTEFAEAIARPPFKATATSCYIKAAKVIGSLTHGDIRQRNLLLSRKLLSSAFKKIKKSIGQEI